jgi:hypothetical protein
VGLSVEKVGFSGCSTESITTGREEAKLVPSMDSMSDHVGEVDSPERRVSRSCAFDRHFLGDRNESTC